MNAKEKITEIKKHPDQHHHTLDELLQCCAIDGIFDIRIMDAHNRYVNLGNSNLLTGVEK